MTLSKRYLVRPMVGMLLVTGLLLVPAPPALAGADVFFGLTIGVPLAPYPVYASPAVIYAYPPPPVVVLAPKHHYHNYGPPYGKAHGYWKKQKKHWKRVHRWHTDD